MFHKKTIESVAQLLGAMGLAGPEELRPEHILRRINLIKIQNYAELYDFLEDGSLLKEHPPEQFARALWEASAESFRPVTVL